MQRTPFSPSRMMMINSLPEIAYLLAISPCSLNVSAQKRLAKFGTLVAENMEKNRDDPITTLLYSTIQAAITNKPETINLPVALLAIYSLRHGGTEASCSELYHQTAQLMSLVTSLKNTPNRNATKDASLPSQECLSNPLSELG